MLLKADWGIPQSGDPGLQKPAGVSHILVTPGFRTDQLSSQSLGSALVASCMLQLSHGMITASRTCSLFALDSGPRGLVLLTRGVTTWLIGRRFCYLRTRGDGGGRLVGLRHPGRTGADTPRDMGKFSKTSILTWSCRSQDSKNGAAAAATPPA